MAWQRPAALDYTAIRGKSALPAEPAASAALVQSVFALPRWSWCGRQGSAGPWPSCPTWSRPADLDRLVLAPIRRVHRPVAPADVADATSFLSSALALASDPHAVRGRGCWLTALSPRLLPIMALLCRMLGGAAMQVE